jgi:hypothetical protein
MVWGASTFSNTKPAYRKYYANTLSQASRQH